MRTGHYSLKILNPFAAKLRVCPSSPTNHLQHTKENSEYIRHNACIGSCDICHHCEKHCICKRKQAEALKRAQSKLPQFEPAQQLPVVRPLSGQYCGKCHLDRSRCECRLCSACYAPKDSCKCPFPSHKPYSRAQRDQDLVNIEKLCTAHVKLMAAGLITGMELHNFLQYAKRMERRCNARLFMIRQMAGDRNESHASSAPIGGTIDL